MASLASATATRQAAAATVSSSSTGMMKWAIGGWMLFIAENAILSENRQFLITDVLKNDDLYHAVYGACSTAAMASILYSYRRLKLQSPPILSLAPLRLGGAFVTMSVGLVLASQAAPKLQVPVQLAPQQDTPPEDTPPGRSRTKEDSPAAAAPPSSWNLKVRCPFDFTDQKPNNSNSSNDLQSVHGLDRVSRHPGLWAFGLTAAGNAFLQPTLPLQIWMLGPLAVAALGGAHQDSRFRRGLGGTLDPHYAALTSNVPFAAMLSGKQGPDSFMTWLTQELKPINAAMATGVAALWVLSRGRGAAAAASSALARKV